MLPSGPTMTSLGWLNWPFALPRLPAMPRLRSFSPCGLNLWTWYPRVPALLPEKSATHTLPSLSTEMPCGVTMTPLPKFASTAPVLRSNLKIGSTGLVSQSTAPPPAPHAAPAPQRSYAQTLPSFGSMSIPAVVPHFRPAGSWPQFLVTLGAGFGSPWPVIVFGTTDDLAGAWDCARDPAHAAMNSVAQTAASARAIRDVDMMPPRKRPLVDRTTGPHRKPKLPVAGRTGMIAQCQAAAVPHCAKRCSPQRKRAEFSDGIEKKD